MCRSVGFKLLVVVVIVLTFVLQILAVHISVVETNTSVLLVEHLRHIKVVDIEFLLIVDYHCVVGIVQENYEEHLESGFGVHG
jgi:hypothetical protein